MGKPVDWACKCGHLNKGTDRNCSKCKVGRRP
jgi:hypothetical protein